VSVALDALFRIGERFIHLRTIDQAIETLRHVGFWHFP
jgi:hypothetical protein